MPLEYCSPSKDKSVSAFAGESRMAAVEPALVVTATGQAHGIHDALGGHERYMTALESFLAAL